MINSLEQHFSENIKKPSFSSIELWKYKFMEEMSRNYNNNNNNYSLRTCFNNEIISEESDSFLSDSNCSSPDITTPSCDSDNYNYNYNERNIGDDFSNESNDSNSSNENNSLPNTYNWDLSSLLQPPISNQLHFIPATSSPETKKTVTLNSKKSPATNSLPTKPNSTLDLESNKQSSNVKIQKRRKSSRMPRKQSQLWKVLGNAAEAASLPGHPNFFNSKRLQNLGQVRRRSKPKDYDNMVIKFSMKT